MWRFYAALIGLAGLSIALIATRGWLGVWIVVAVWTGIVSAPKVLSLFSETGRVRPDGHVCRNICRVYCRIGMHGFGGHLLGRTSTSRR